MAMNRAIVAMTTIITSVSILLIILSHTLLREKKKRGTLHGNVANKNNDGLL